MTDIVERLRAVILPMEAGGLSPEAEVVSEGIAEIERLRADVDRLLKRSEASSTRSAKPMR